MNPTITVAFASLALWLFSPDAIAGVVIGKGVIIVMPDGQSNRENREITTKPYKPLFAPSPFPIPRHGRKTEPLRFRDLSGWRGLFWSNPDPCTDGRYRCRR